MKEKYKILHLQDVQTEAELVKRELKRSDADFDYLVIDCETEYIKALHEFEPDIILVAHSLPGFGSFEALRILREQNINIPFIVITATMTEDLATGILRQRADDYIMKDRLKRLPHAVMNAIQKYKDIKIILSDINMPGMSGLELLEKIKQKPERPAPFVMMISAYGDEENLNRSVKLGADYFLTKPVDFAMLKEKLKAWCNSTRSV